DARRIDRPALSRREGLAEEGEVGERLHRLHAVLALELLAKEIEIELALEMVHACLKQGVAVERAPKPDGPELRSWRERLMGEISGELVRREIDVREDDDAGARLLEHLRSPAGFGSGVEAFAKLETHALEDRDQVREALARRAIRVVVMVRPTEAETILPPPLDPRRMIPPFPVLPLRREEDVAGAIGSDPSDRLIDERASPLEAFLVALEDASPAAKHLVDARRFDVARRVLRRQLEASQPVALDEPELRLVRGLDSREPKRRARIAEDLVRLPLAPRREEVADRLDAEVETRSRAAVASRPRKEATRMTEEPKQIATGLVRRDESDLR